MGNEKDWVIHNEVVDFEHDGDVERDLEYIYNALGGAILPQLRFKTTYESCQECEADCDCEGYATIEIRGNGEELKKKVQEALDTMYDEEE